jgi:hypothetical protein
MKLNGARMTAIAGNASSPHTTSSTAEGRSVKSWWQKWTIDKPAALGDWLWLVLVVQLADFLNRLTLRRVIEVLAITLLTLIFVQTFPLDIAILFAGDMLMYLELVTLVSLVATTLRVGRALSHALMLVKTALDAALALIPRLARRVRVPRRKRPVAGSTRGKEAADDRPAFGWGSVRLA